jgi:ubiquinone/menaquinone biosynthesis C-methylase UbiE
MSQTSWQPVNRWYNESVGAQGHYYHQHVILPGVLRLLQLDSRAKLLDLACGQGVLARAVDTVDKQINYLGVDLAKGLIEAARQQDRNPNHQYIIGDVSKPLAVKDQDFTHAAVILALQNIEHPERVINNITQHLTQQGKLILVLNHPCFRIPRQSSWEIDEKNKLQYRRINRYLSPLKIPITAHPGQAQRSAVTWSFHWPLSSLSEWLNHSGLVIEKMEEWGSDKKSEGKAAKMEDRSRSEFPLFLTVLARKNS